MVSVRQVSHVTTAMIFVHCSHAPPPHLRNPGSSFFFQKATSKYPCSVLGILFLKVLEAPSKQPWLPYQVQSVHRISKVYWNLCVSGELSISIALCLSKQVLDQSQHMHKTPQIKRFLKRKKSPQHVSHYIQGTLEVPRAALLPSTVKLIKPSPSVFIHF